MKPFAFVRLVLYLEGDNLISSQARSSRIESTCRRAHLSCTVDDRIEEKLLSRKLFHNFFWKLRPKPQGRPTANCMVLLGLQKDIEGEEEGEEEGTGRKSSIYRSMVKTNNMNNIKLQLGELFYLFCFFHLYALNYDKNPKVLNKMHKLPLPVNVSSLVLWLDQWGTTKYSKVAQEFTHWSPANAGGGCCFLGCDPPLTRMWPTCLFLTLPVSLSAHVDNNMVSVEGGEGEGGRTKEKKEGKGAGGQRPWLIMMWTAVHFCFWHYSRIGTRKWL